MESAVHRVAPPGSGDVGILQTSGEDERREREGGDEEDGEGEEEGRRWRERERTVWVPVK